MLELPGALISAGWDGSLRRTSLPTRRRPLVTINQPAEDHSHAIASLDVTADGTAILTGTLAGTLSLCSARSGVCTVTRNFPDAIKATYFGSQSLVLATDINGLGFFVLDAKRLTDVYSRPVGTAVASPKVDELFIHTTSQQAQIVDARNGLVRCSTTDRLEEIVRLAFAPDGSVVLIANAAGRVWSINASSCALNWVRDLGIEKPMTLVFSPDSQLFALGGASGGAVFPTSDADHVVLPFEDRNVISDIDFDPTGRKVLVAGMSRRVELYSIANRKRVFSPVYTGATPWVARFDPSGLRFAVGYWADASARYEVSIHDSATGSTIGESFPQSREVFHARFFPDGNRLAVACSDGVVSVWNTASEGGDLDTLIRMIGESTGQTIDFGSGAIQSISANGGF